MTAKDVVRLPRWLWSLSFWFWGVRKEILEGGGNYLPPGKTRVNKDFVSLIYPFVWISNLTTYVALIHFISLLM